jgi:hypothetical protein
MAPPLPPPAVNLAGTGAAMDRAVFSPRNPDFAPLGFRNKGRANEEAMAYCRRWPRTLHKRRGTALSEGPATSAPSV